MRAMLLYAGIDEAGYGPLMGPLCVGCSEWTIDGEHPPESPPDLWALMRGAICRKARDRKGRVAVADSKQLKGSAKAKRHPLSEIERGVLALLSIAADCPGFPATDAEFLSTVGAELLDSRGPWYEGATELPVAGDHSRVAIGRAMIVRACAKGSVRDHRVSCLSADAAEINEAARSGAVKSSVPWTLLMRHIHALRKRHSDLPLRVAVDRQGGRVRYREDLMREFDGARLTILTEDERESAYRLDGIGAPCVISFSVEGEQHHLPIALASMTAKYTRELWMIRLNRWFASQVDGVRPTAGYVEDGRRFLACVRGALADRELPEALLVRSI